ncbi:MAG TPA: PD-(D/E)XK nuclease family protein [Thermoleophilaceae bacterium]|nr:PD-(D/E)XK nuclease family protein [Thermoleophilaceae bacterium]
MLTLVTGPANAAKAGAVLGPLRDRLDEEPVLVVPAFQDVEHSRRELAETGATFGAQVVRFSHLSRMIARRTGYHARVASELQQQLVAEDAVRRAGFTVLADSAGRPGFARAALRFFAELERSMVEPPRLIQALRGWAGDGPRAAYAEEIGELYRRYREGLEAAGLVDDDLFAWGALSALRAQPSAWAGTPVFVYGFDDFTELEFRTIEELAVYGEADVVVSLPFEPGREAFKATATLRERLREVAAREIELDAVSDHYDKGSRAALHALERRLFEPGAAPADPGDAVSLHAAGGERAELELCGAEVVALLRGGTPPGDVAVVFRDPPRYASLVEQVFGAYGIPYSMDRAVPFAHTGVGRGLLALLRCALLEGSADDLLAYLRTPGLVREPGLADRLEADVRRRGERTADGARALWEERPGRWPLEVIDELRDAPDAAALLQRLAYRLERLFSAPYRRAAARMEGAELDDPRAFRAGHAALTEMRAVVEADPAVALDARHVHETLAELPVRVGEEAQTDRVQVASPLDVRARRFDTVFVCGLQEKEFPQGGSPDAFLPDTDRRELARASGLMLPLREDRLERERYLFYVCASRAERRLVLSSRTSDEEGNPSAPSFFVDDVRVVFEELPERRRGLADVTWPLDQAPTQDEWERSVARSGPRRRDAEVGPLALPAALEPLAAKDAVSAYALEKFAGCPVGWLVDVVLEPEKLEPDPEAMVRGSYAHKVLETTYRELRAQTGERRVNAGNLALAERLLVDAMERLRGEFRLSPDQTRVRAAVRRLEFDLLRYLRHEAGGDGSFEPEYLELRFGFEDSDYEAVELAGGTRVRGVIDRVDTWDGWALVRDYKSGKTDRYKLSDWRKENRFQAALYMLVAERALGLKPAGGVYVPLRGTDRRARGIVAAELADRLGGDFVDRDVVPEAEFAEWITWAEESIGEVATRMRAGDLESCPDSCAWRGGCSHPSICRVET